VHDTVISVYSGNTLNTLTRIVGNDDHSNGNISPYPRLSSCSFYATKGITYHFAVDAFNAGNVTPTSKKVVLQLRLFVLRKATLYSPFAANFNVNGSGAGQVSYTTTPKGSLSGKLLYGSKSYPFAGVFGVDGFYHVTMAQKGIPGALPISVHIDGSEGGYAVIVLGSAGQANAPFMEQATFTPQNINPHTGVYTGVIDSSQVDIGGDGVFSMTVKPNGAITAAGSTPDGVAFTYSSVLCKSPSSPHYGVPFYKSLNSGKSSLAMALEIYEAGLVDTLAGSALYTRAAPTNGSPYYPQGIGVGLSVFGSGYSKPLAGNRALGFLNPNGAGALKITNSDGELIDNITEGLTLSATNKFTFDSKVRKPALTVNVSTGLVTGSITEPAGKKRTIKAVLTLKTGVPTLRGTVSGVKRNLALSVTP
jgi:hypothetical protein